MGTLNISEIMDRSIEVLRKYIKTIIIFSLGYGIIVFIATMILIFIGSIFIALTINPMAGGTFPIILFILMVIAIMSLSLSSNIGVIKIVSQEFSQEKVYAHNALKHAFKNIFKVMGIVITSALIFLPVGGIFAGVAYYLYNGLANSSIFIGTYGAREITLLIFSIIVSIIAIFVIFSYSTTLVFSLHATAIEDKGVFASIKRSFKLVKNNFWKILGCVILISLTTAGIKGSLESFVSLIASIIYFIMKFLNVETDYMTFITMVLTTTRWPLNLLSWMVISPIGTIMISLMYFNQRFKKEGYDILLRVNTLPKNNERKPLSDAEYNNSL